MNANSLSDNTPSGPDSPFELLESLRLEQGRYWLLDGHLKRLADAAQHFGYAVALPDVRESLARTAQDAPEGTWKVRCLADAQGAIRVGRETLEPDGKFPLAVALAPHPVSRSEPFLYYKTTRRHLYDTPLEQTRQAWPDVYDALLWNEEEELTEFTRGNAVVELRGRLVTPPVESGLLAGVLRAELLARGDIHERVVKRSDLAHMSRLWLINSVRGWLPARLRNNPHALARI